MKIKKGDKFLCIKDVISFDGRGIAYKKGEIYQSECHECITNIQGNKHHYWRTDGEDAPHIYFKPLSDVGNIYTDVTDRIRCLYEGYQGDKFGDPTKAKFFGVKFSDGEVVYLSANDEYENPFFNRDYVTEDTFIELTGLTDKPVVDQDEYSWVNNGLQDVAVKKTDSIVKSVIDKYRQRSEVGIEKYGTTLEDNEDGIEIFLTHLQEEMMDATLYIEKLKHKFAKLKKHL